MHFEKSFNNNYAISFIAHVGLYYTRTRFQIVQTLNTPEIHCLGSNSRSLNQHPDWVMLTWTSFRLWESGQLLPLLATAFMETPTAYFWTSGHLWNVLSIFHEFKDLLSQIRMNFAIWEIWLMPVRPVLESLKQESCHSCHTRASILIWRSFERKPSFTCLGRVYSVTQTGYLWSPCSLKNAFLKEKKKTKIFVSWKPMTPGS